LRFYTGGTNERLRINSSGDVGIGTDTMNAPLTVVQNDSSGYIANFRQKNASNSAQILIDSPTDNNIRPASIDLAQAGTVKWSLGQAYAAQSSQAFHIATSSLSANDTNAKLTITTAGSVGIASAIPRSGFKLDVNGDLSLGESSGTDNTYLEQKQNGDLHIINSGRAGNGGSNTGGAGGIGINRYNTLAGGTTYFRDFTVYDGKNTKVLVVDGSSGEVGIGTDDPTGAFEINWNGSSTDMIMLSRPETGGNFARLGHNTASGTSMLDVRSEGHIRFLTNGNNERVRFDSSGRVLIATTTEGFGTYGEELTIGSPGGDHAGMTIRSGTGHKGTIYFSDGTSGDAEYRGAVQYDHSDDSLRLAASTQNQLFIQSNIIDYFQHRNIYQRNQNIAITDGGNKQFTISGLGYGFAKLQVAGYGEGQFFNVEVTVGGLMASGSQYYSATIIANGSSGSCDVNFGANQTTYVVTISNNVGNGGSIHCTSVFTGSGNTAHPNLAVS